MRISTSWSQQLGVNAMNAQQVKMSKTQMQLSTGLRILNPSDDPAASVKALNLHDTIDKTKQYQDNIATTRSRLNIEEGSLESAENVLFRTKELTVQALNSTLTPTDHRSIKAEVDELLKQMVGIANTKNANGEYVFAGDLSTTPPFAWDGAVGSYVYQGGVNQRSLEIAEERKVADGDLGDNVFINIDSVSQHANTTVDGAESDQRSVFDTLQALSFALGGKYDVPEATVTGDRFMRFGVDYSATGLGATTFNLEADDGLGTTPAVFVNKDITLNSKFANLDEVVTEINNQLNAAPSRPEIIARSDGNNIEFVSATKGKDSSIQITAGAGSFLTDFGFAAAEIGKGADLTATITATNSFDSSTGKFQYASPNAVFELVDEAGNKGTITLSNNYANNAALVADIKTQIDAAAGIVGKIEVDPTANPIQFHSISSGGGSTVTINQISGDFLRDSGFESGERGNVFFKTVNDVLADLDTALSNIIETRTSVGGRGRALDDQEIQNEKFIFDMQTTLSVIEDLDFTEAISRFNIEQVALQAAQQAYAQVQDLSLFNFI